MTLREIVVHIKGGVQTDVDIHPEVRSSAQQVPG